jgi:hypothetical protein
MPNAAVKVRQAFETAKKPLTLSEIKTYTNDLERNEISMALCYLRRQRYVSRSLIENPNTGINTGRNSIWLYEYHQTKLPKE